MSLFLHDTFRTLRSNPPTRSSSPTTQAMDTDMCDGSEHGLLPAQPLLPSSHAQQPVSSLGLAGFGRWARTPLLTSAMEFGLPLAGAGHSAPPSPSPLGTSSSGDEMNPFGLTGLNNGSGHRHVRRASVRGLAAAASFSNFGASTSRRGSDSETRELGHQRSASTSSLSMSVEPVDMFSLDTVPLSRSRPVTPSTPPRRRASMSNTQQRRAIATTPKQQPRLQHLKLDASINIAEQELRMEAHFQRLLSNVETAESALPALRSPRPVKFNRGRFPEEVVLDDEPTQDDNASSDEGGDEPSGSASVAMSFHEDRAMSEDGSIAMLRASPAISLMDLDQPAYYGSNGGSSNGTGTPRDAWRQTPPPTSNNGSRVSKRKFAADERYEPYAYPSAKRRAVSPAVAGMPSPLVIPRSPIIRPMAYSVTSSPVFARPQPAIVAAVPMSLNSSPIMRPSAVIMSHMSSPIMRPIVKLRASAATNAAAAAANGTTHLPEPAVDGAGSAVSGLTLT